MTKTTGGPHPFANGPYLRAATICERVLSERDGVLSFIRLVDRVQLRAVGPSVSTESGPLPIGLKLVLMFSSGETRGSHDISILMERPSGLLADLVSQTALFEGEDRGVNIVARHAARVRDAGDRKRGEILKPSRFPIFQIFKRNLAAQIATNEIHKGLAHEPASYSLG